MYWGRSLGLCQGDESEGCGNGPAERRRFELRVETVGWMGNGTYERLNLEHRMVTDRASLVGLRETYPGHQTMEHHLDSGRPTMKGEPLGYTAAHHALSMGRMGELSIPCRGWGKVTQDDSGAPFLHVCFSKPWKPGGRKGS